LASARALARRSAVSVQWALDGRPHTILVHGVASSDILSLLFKQYKWPRFLTPILTVNLYKFCQRPYHCLTR